MRATRVKCDCCGKYFKIGNRKNGIPNGVSFIQENGHAITMCADCIIKVSEMSDEDMQRFADDLRKVEE